MVADRFRNIDVDVKAVFVGCDPEQLRTHRAKFGGLFHPIPTAGRLWFLPS